MNLSEWFSYQLKAGGEGFVWAVEQVPVERREIAPPTSLGEWTVKRHIFHLLFHERNYVLPTMCHWLGESLPTVESPNEKETWETIEPTESIESLLAKFQEARAELLSLLPRFVEGQWKEVHDIGIDANLTWVMTKAYQHTASHINDILMMALFWDVVVAREQKQQGTSG